MSNEPQKVRSVVSPVLQPALVYLASLQPGQRSLLEVLHDVARLAADSLPDVDEVSLTLAENRWTPTTAFTGALAATLDERQYDSDFGPALTSMRSRTVIRIDDTSSERRFPGFAAVAQRQGVTSVLALPVPLSGELAGGLCLYRRSVGKPVSVDTENLAAAFAGYAGGPLASHALLVSRERDVGHLQASALTRAVIDQAKGIIMYRSACDADEAFRRIATYSQQANRKVREIAVDITTAVARGETLPDSL